MRIKTLSFLFLVSLQATAQQPRIWGMTPNGGANTKGTLFSLAPDGSDLNTVYAFDDASGWGPEGGLCLAPNGMIYGATTIGGGASPAAGTLFKVDPADGIFHKLIDFNISNGGFNRGALIVGQDGLLYGASLGGTGGGGSIYRVDPADDSYAELYALQQATDGAAVESRLLQLPDGVLFGACSQGGANGEAGTLFKYDPATDVFTKLHDFDGAIGGRTPYGGLCLGGNGWIYGTTFEGGTNNTGIIFKYDPVNDVFEKVMDFETVGGSNCWGTMVNVGPDLLMGTVVLGGLNAQGFIYSLVPSSDTFTIVHSFASLTGGAPLGSLTMGPDMQLYGMTSSGGPAGFGTVYRFDPVTFQRTNLHAFTNGADGGLPRGELLFTGAWTGIAETATAPLFSVGPNPSMGEVVLHCEAAQLPMQARVTDALGRVLQQLTITDVSTTLDLGVASGVRCITLVGHGRVHTERVMVH